MSKYDAWTDLRALPSMQSGQLGCQGSLNPSLTLHSSQLRLLLSHLLVQVSYMQRNCCQALLCLQQVWVGRSSTSSGISLIKAAANAIRQQLQPHHNRLQQSTSGTISRSLGKQIIKMHVPEPEAHAITSDLNSKAM